MSFFIGRDCLWHKNFVEDILVRITTDTEHVPFETQNIIKEINNYPKII